MHSGVNACSRASYLKRHQQVLTGEKTDKVSLSGKLFTASETSTQAQEGVCAGEKLYNCSSCGMNFSTSIYLLAHKKKHCQT